MFYLRNSSDIFKVKFFARLGVGAYLNLTITSHLRTGPDSSFSYGGFYEKK
jgi:hypothetical protein